MQAQVQEKAILMGLADDDLVARYLQEQDDRFFRILVERHHDRLFSRFLSELKNRADATDLEQQLWLRVFRNLKNYKSEGKFAEYLSRVAGNLLTDFWRSKDRRAGVFVENRYFDDQDSNDAQATLANDVTNDRVQGGDQETGLINEDLVDYLVSVLIPSLPIEQRMAWLLRHESEYWEPKKRLEWHHLADLNGIGGDEAWSLFESARNKLMSTLSSKKHENETLFDEEILIFSVWTQAQRLRKEEQYTWDYFAQMIGVPTTTMKTRYRAAQKYLSDGLKARMNE